MKTIHTFKFLLSSLIFVFCTLGICTARADDYEDNEIGYETLIQELSKKQNDVEAIDPLSQVEIHVGVAFANSLFAVALDNGSTLYASQRGIQASLGIDLFSSHWMAEGAVLNFGERQYDQARINLREFDLKVIYKNRIEGSLGYRLGAGLGARYLSVARTGATQGETSYTTPFSILSGGIETFVTKNVSLGVEVATRNSITYETPDQSALDLCIRVDGHF